MRCPACGRDTLYVAEQGVTLFFWCPRCGTLVEKTVGGGVESNIPEERKSADGPTS